MKQTTTQIQYDKLLDILPLYMALNPDKCQDEQHTYAFRMMFKDQFPGVVTKVRSLPLNQETIVRVIDWQSGLSKKFK